MILEGQAGADLEDHAKVGLYSAGQGEPLKAYKPFRDRVIHSCIDFY